MGGKVCSRCDKVLTKDEIGLYRKLVDDDAESPLCLSCVAEWFGCDVEDLLDKIEEFKDEGCVLFS